MDTCPFRRSDLPPLTDRIKKLPVLRGYPTPWFVAKIGDEYDFRVADAKKWNLAVRDSLCWVCGQKLGNVFTFVLGPMCAITRTTSEPPTHPECAEWSVKGCPFMSKPQMVRREEGLPEETVSRGMPIKRNPGATALWTTTAYKLFSDGRGGQLISVGPCKRISWWREGRGATRDEVFNSIDSGMPLLRAECDKETTEVMRLEAHEELDGKYQHVTATLLPRE